MKKSEKVLLIGTIGLGVVMAVSVVGGKAGRQAALLGLAAQNVPGTTAAKTAPRATIELLATKRVALEPLEPQLRNPFRPPEVRSEETEKDSISPGAPVRRIGMEKVAQLQLTGIFDEDGGLAALVDGKVVRAGDPVGELRVVKVEPRGVVFEYRGEVFLKKFYEPLQGPYEPEPGLSSAPGKAQPENP